MTAQGAHNKRFECSGRATARAETCEFIFYRLLHTASVLPDLDLGLSRLDSVHVSQSLSKEWYKPRFNSTSAQYSAQSAKGRGA